MHGSDYIRYIETQTFFKNTGDKMEIKFRCMRCNSTHDEIEDAAYCCAYIQRIAICRKCGFKTLSSKLADNHKCEEN